LSRQLTVKRKGYWRKEYTRKDGVKVKRTWVPAATFKIPDRGKKGRGKAIIPVSDGKLTKLGYSTSLPAKKRRSALKKAIKKYGATSVFRMLNAQVILRKRIQRGAKKRFLADRNWVKSKHMKD